MMADKLRMEDAIFEVRMAAQVLDRILDRFSEAPEGGGRIDPELGSAIIWTNAHLQKGVRRLTEVFYDGEKTEVAGGDNAA